MKKLNIILPAMPLQTTGKVVVVVFLFLVFFVSGTSAQQAGYSLRLDGTNDYVSLPTGIVSSLTTFTVEAWVYWGGPSGSGNQRIFDFGNSTSGGYMFLTPDRWNGPVRFAITNTSTGGEQELVSNIIPSLNTWFHVAVTRDNSNNGKLYINGAVVATGTISITPSSLGNTANNWLGKSQWNDPYFNGKLDEVRIWNVARTQQQIRANMFSELVPANEATLVHYYKLNETTGTTASDSKGGSSGTLVNGPLWQVSGCFDGPRAALSFNGSNSYVNLGDVIENLTTYTAEAWVYCPGYASGYKEICSKSYVSVFALNGDGSSYRVHANFGNGIAYGPAPLNSTTTIPTGQWVHVASTRDGSGNMKIFINGIQDASTGVNNFTGSNSENRGIGNYGSPISDHYFNGYIDELCIWSTERTADQIRENMMHPLAGNETGLLAYYRMEQSGTLSDNGTSGYDGTLNNTSWVASSAYNTWIGCTSSDMSVGSNWSQNWVALSTDNLGLYTNLGYEASISGSALKNLLISSSAAPTFSGALNVTGNLFLQNDLTLYGSTANSAANLYIGTGKTLTIPYNVGLTVSGTLANSGTLTIQSTASGTGSLINSSAGVIATVQRYLNNADWTNWKDGWHFLSSPVASQAISPDFTTDPYDFYCWNEPSNLWVNYENMSGGGGTAPYFDVVNGSANFTVGKGYLAAYDAEGTKSFSGTLNVADVAVTGLTITGSTQTNRSWHLLGNPYASALTWDATATWGLTNIAGTAKIWNEANQSYTDLTSSPSTVIPATNGFMVQVSSGTGSLTIPASKRVHSSQGFYKSEVSCVKLVARNTSYGNGQESNIFFNSEATAGFDLMYDGEFLAGYGPLFYSVAGSENLSTNTLPSVDGSIQIPFDFIKNDGTEFTIEAETISGIDGAVILNDLKTGSAQDLALNPIYSFTSSYTDNPERFLITFNHLGVNETKKERSFSIYTLDNDIIVVNSKTGSEGDVFVYNLPGQLVARQPLSGECMTRIRMQSGIGYYVVKVITIQQTYSAKVLLH